ncbi:MAG: hypothetical protein EHM36_06990 [Deltaproteobacteria bacterium]|nr:MAG: hypothetical protein EHM36_06990 [Deltaproteobacteria bacterium]
MEELTLSERMKKMLTTEVQIAKNEIERAKKAKPFAVRTCRALDTVVAAVPDAKVFIEYGRIIRIDCNEIADARRVVRKIMKKFPDVKKVAKNFNPYRTRKDGPGPVWYYEVTISDGNGTSLAVKVTPAFPNPRCKAQLHTEQRHSEEWQCQMA